jgi:ATP-dependent exoDNAse (exonuclease V) beta subunit
LDETLVVEAAAGSGKTTELVRRIVHLLAEARAEVSEIVAVTFTEKAAGELKLRLRVEIEAARSATADAARRTCLERALAHLEEAAVNTIHGFCADLLRERPVEACIDPRFGVLTEGQSRALFDRAFDLWLQETLEDPPEGIRRSLRRASRGRDGGPITRLRDAAWQLASWRDFPAAWVRAPFAREDQISALTARLHDFAEATGECTRTDDAFYRDMGPARAASAAIRRDEAVRGRDSDGLEARLIQLLDERSFAHPNSKGAANKWRGRIPLADVRRLREELVEGLQEFAPAADADLAALLQAELRECTRRYELLKQRAGQLDFLDLLLRTRDLLRDHEPVRREFQRRYRRILVDEFQDTDPLQAEILLLLASDDPAVSDWRETAPSPGKLFIVGDPKQSIYRFRRADVAVYQQVKDMLLERGARLIRLSTNFRSVPAVLHCINAAFGFHMRADARILQTDYVDLVPSRCDPPEQQPALVALPVPKPYGAARITFRAIAESLPEAVGAFVHWLISESGWTVAERSAANHGEERRVQIAPRHICVLFRRFESFGEDVSRAYVEALEARSVPHLLVGGRSFHRREEVETMRAALSAIEWPDDELSVFATLHGAIFALGDEELLQYRMQYGKLHPFRLPQGEIAGNLQPVIDALALLRSLHVARNYVPAVETISRLLTTTRAHAAFALRPSGEQALANVLHVAEIARRYEAAGGISFRGFVDELRQEADSGDEGEAPILEEGSDGVRMMTVHKAKGLEFPVVVLADLGAQLAHTQTSRHVDPERGLCALRLGPWSPRELRERETLEIDRDRAEALRLGYVAATRARDLLVIPAVGDLAQEARWFSALNVAIYPEMSRRRDAAPAPRCPAFGPDSVLIRPNAEPEGPCTVQPGRHSFGSGESAYSVVWWDPRKLNLGIPARFGLRQDELLSKDAPAAVIAEDLARYQAWKEDLAATLARGARPSLVVRTVTEQAAAATEGENPERVTILSVAGAGQERPHGPRFGTLVHAILASVSLDAGRDEIEQHAQLQARIFGAPEEERSAAVSVVRDAIAHPLLRRASRAFAEGRCRRECPVVLRADDRELIEGVVDLAFEEAGVWTVVDFKTDRELEGSLAAYRRQVGLYADMVSRATGCPAHAVLLRL